MNILKILTLDKSNISQSGEARTIAIEGDNGAVFSLAIQNTFNGRWYDFNKLEFLSPEYKLQNIKIESFGVYKKRIVFPKLPAGEDDGVLYNVFLHAENGTKHADYKEVRDIDGSIDVNLTTGSNSNLVMKQLYQTYNTSLLISGYSKNSLLGASSTNVTIETSVGKPSGNIPFSFTMTAINLLRLILKKQPTEKDIMVFSSIGVGDPVQIPGENIYPNVTTAANSANNGGTRVDSTNDGEITMYVVASTVAAVGDRVTVPGVSHKLNENVHTVTSVSSGTGKTFEIFPVVTIADDQVLTFSNRMNYRWKVNNVNGIVKGMQQLTGTFFAAGTGVVTVSDYLTQFTVLEGLQGEYKIDDVRVPAVSGAGNPFVITRALPGLYKGVTQFGEITLSEQAKFIFGETDFSNTSGKIFAKGVREIKRLSGYDVEFFDLKTELAPTTSLTTSSPSASTSFNIASALGIADDISTVTGIGITKDASGDNPLVTAITNVGGATWDNSGAATITLNVAQTLETGVLLTFAGSSRVATISGRIKVKSAGPIAETLRFDVESLLST